MRHPIILSLLFATFFAADTVVADDSTAAAAREAAAVDVPELRLEPYVFEAADGTRVDTELGSFTVPENRRRADSRTLELKFVRFKSTSSEPGSPIVYLAGGPGGAGTDAARYRRFALFMAFREVADVIAFDQRGTGMSGGDELECQEHYGYPLEKPGDPRAMSASGRRSAAACAAAMRAKGVDLAGYNSIESADDLDALRRALGARKITLWGISYGTHLSLATLKRHGEHIDRVILAGLEGPDQSYKLPSNVQKLMAEIATIAGAAPAVREKLPDLLAALGEVLAQLERQPVTAEVVDPRSGQKVKVGVSAFDVRVVVSSMLRGPSSFDAMPELIYNMQQGDFTGVAQAAGRFRAGPLGSAMSYAMDCASGSTTARLQRITREAQGTLLKGAINQPFPGICDAWDVPDLGDAFRAPVRSEVPALFISGTLDGRTPPSNAEEILNGFPAGVHLVIEGAGHSDPLFMSSPKIAETMLAFLRGESVTDRRIVLPPVQLITPRRTVEVVPSILERYVGRYRINEKEVREVILEGGQLFTRRGEGRKLPIKPQSETGFFYPGSPTHLTFVTDEAGRVQHMMMVQNGEESVAERID